MSFIDNKAELADSVKALIVIISETEEKDETALDPSNGALNHRCTFFPPHQFSFTRFQTNDVANFTFTGRKSGKVTPSSKMFLTLGKQERSFRTDMWEAARLLMVCLIDYDIFFPTKLMIRYIYRHLTHVWLIALLFLLGMPCGES